ncbi:Alpha/Beta hydrolase protein [Aspergillus karnatakaensis]|uniref:putative esterase/lipase n=1 Tax=Aspergillus karnatakaensis TaxID=1810916 RepID=UPI003CCE30A6
MFSLAYIYHKVVVLFLRALARSTSSIHPTPDDVYQIESRDPSRKIKAHVYESKAASNPRPVLINFHGSGFVLTAHGADDEFCRLMSQRTAYTALDVQYRLAPEHPFPAALHDVEDVVNWVQQQPDRFDLSRVVLSGFSAGGNLVLAASSNLFPPEKFNAIVAFYPPVDLVTDPGLKTSPDPKGHPLPAPLARLFDSCYIPSSYDKRDPRISPLYAQSDRLPNRALIITAAGDSLAAEAERLAVRLREAGREVVLQRMEGCDHGWNIAPKNAVQQEARDKAYDMVVAMLENNNKQ